MYVTPDKKTGQVKTVRQLCDDYIHEHNKLKELRLTKVVEWNYPELTRGKHSTTSNETISSDDPSL